MQLDEALRRLEKAGTAQNRKVYARHGVRTNMYGVSYANLKAMARKIRTDHALAQQLWQTGNHDARILATMVADAASATEKEIDRWARDLDSYPIADAVADFVARTRFARAKAEAWKNAGAEWIESAGWGLIARLAGAGAAAESDLAEHLKTIERDIHGRANRVRYAMNSALIAIGGYCDGLRAKALAAAERIGPVEVDHGETGCKTPDAASYIQKVAAYAATRAAGASRAKAASSPRRKAASPPRRRAAR
jgi:3-methyladenine DNA glycosylase AlkD